MNTERYFSRLPKDAPLPISWKPPSPKRPKRARGRPKKKYPIVTVTLDDSDKENDPDGRQGTDSCMDMSETTEHRKNGRHEVFIQHEAETCHCCVC